LGPDDEIKNILKQSEPPSAPAAPNASQDMLTKYLAGLEQSRKQAPGLALMAAGLGIAGQRSPYGLSNIGAGGLQGLQSYADAQKTNMTGEAAGLSAQAAMDRNKVYQQHYALAGQQALDTKYSAQVQKINDNIEKEIKDGMMPASQIPAYRKTRFMEMIKQNPSLVKWYYEQGGDLSKPSIQLDTVPGNVIGTVKPKS
jgi:hypothetical protein